MVLSQFLEVGKVVFFGEICLPKISQYDFRLIWKPKTFSASFSPK